MNHYVQPRGEIISYNTQWSGVSAETLVGVTRRLEHILDELMTR